jgi:putative tryptophan/tyrosine transport system substrate-binding protein
VKRREFILALGGAAAVWPFAAGAQQPAMPVIGFLNGASPGGYQHYVAAFRDGLKEGGFIEGQNVAIEFRWAEGHYERLPELAADLVRRQVAVLAATSTPANLIGKAATQTIPVVFTTASDPVRIGLVASLSHPGGNVTGVTQLNVELGPKRLELAHELMPDATAMALLVNPVNPSAAGLSKDVAAAALTLGLKLHVMNASTEPEMEAAFAAFPSLHAGVLMIGTDAFFNARSRQLAALALQYKVPTIYQFHEFTAAGGLMSHGGSIVDSYHAAGVLAAKILKGEKPADLPVQQSTKVELIINLKTAKALNITIRLVLLGRADEVIE